MRRQARLCLQKLFFHSFLLSAIRISISLDTISPGESIRDGDSVVSTGQSFELGFFSPVNSTRRYLGIWYEKISNGTVVWVANRETPLLDRSGVLSITHEGILVLLNSTKNVVWSSNRTKTVKNPVAQLLETGNLVVRDGNDSDTERYEWQSFDYPGDTNLPGMKLGINLVTGVDWSISSWKSLDDPARGEYTYGIDPRGYPQLVYKKGSEVLSRMGSWNGVHLTGLPRVRPNPVYRFEFVFDEKEVYYIIHLLNRSVPSRLMVNASGVLQRLTWIPQTKSWARYISTGNDLCDNYDICGRNAKCINKDPVCACLEGFEPKSARDWSLRDWTDGCVRRTALACNKGEGFVKHKGLKLPDTSNSWYNRSMSRKECEELCFRNCSCTAYANLDIRGGGSGCLIWFHDLIDMREFSEKVPEQDLYVRMDASYINTIKRKRKSEEKRTGIIACFVILSMGILLVGWILYIRKRKLKNKERMKNIFDMDDNNKGKKEDLELPKIDLSTIVKATDHFSNNNQLGKGGFGLVYKGTLDGQEIAVKRLAINSCQGPEEFINEILLITKLQHRNLVKLLGYCIEGDERMLIYEYMPNKSLDYFIFDESRCKILDWSARFNIIDGIARGLLYLHQDSRLRIIHRDLKASNVLLDNDMNPKISDFGLARIFGGNQTEANTKRLGGTYGYMAPEYAADGLFSVKSDIFSFGVLLLEIVSGKKNRGFYSDDHFNLVGHAWKLWMEERPMELIDNMLGKSHALSEIIRCIHVGLLCVQQRPEDRPTMSTVVLLLCGESSLPQPKQPGYFIGKIEPKSESSSRNYESTSPVEITMTTLDPR